MGYAVKDEFVWPDTRSGEDPESAALDSMLKAVRQRLVDAVFVYTSDRLSRDPLHLLVLIQEFQDAGVLLEFVDGQLEDTPEGRLVLYVQGYAAQKERRQIAERTMRGKEAVARSGRLPCGTGAGMYGYDYDPVAKTRTINEEQAAIVRLMFQIALDGVSPYLIGVDLRNRGIRGPRGGVLESRTVQRMLQNESYAGVDYYGLYRCIGSKGQKRSVTARDPSEVIRITGVSPPIVSRKLFDDVPQRGIRRGPD